MPSSFESRQQTTTSSAQIVRGHSSEPFADTRGCLPMIALVSDWPASAGLSPYNMYTNDHLFPCAAGLQPIGVDFRDIIQELSNDHSPLQLPFLRRISLELKNHLMESVFNENTFLFTSFPKQVTELEINFAYGEDTNPKTIQGIKSRVWQRFALQNAKSARLEKLMVLGASSGVTKELLGVFGSLEKLESFKQDAWKEAPVKPEAQADVVVAREEDDSSTPRQAWNRVALPRT
ncbi:hypothetical protein V5O48_004569 [Marasmius crinis-equi]|uniref:Uncharacterized protein n=1 Tax=Marasmius crinis-equi TaxID=585013 RepID=A0ABR3FPM6_9AGAR